MAVFFMWRFHSFSLHFVLAEATTWCNKLMVRTSLLGVETQMCPHMASLPQINVYICKPLVWHGSKNATLRS